MAENVNEKSLELIRQCALELGAVNAKVIAVPKKSLLPTALCLNAG